MLRGVRLLIFGLTACVASAQVDWRFAHPNADLRVNVNLQAVLKSPAVAEMVKKAQAGPKDQAAQMQFVMGLLSSVDRVSISARQLGAKAKEPDVLVLIAGRFDPASLQSMFPSTGTSHVKQVGLTRFSSGKARVSIRPCNAWLGRPCPDYPMNWSRAIS